LTLNTQHDIVQQKEERAQMKREATLNI